MSSHWDPATDDAACTCLTRDDHTLPHAARCDVVAHTDYTGDVDRDDIRELAELAAYRDIDTALAVYRGHRARNAR